MIVNPTGGNTSSLLAQIIAERNQARNDINPSAQPTAPLRQIVQNPLLQNESPDSARVAAVKPELATQAQGVVPPTPTGTPGAVPAAVPPVGAVIPPTVKAPVNISAPGPSAPSPTSAPPPPAAAPPAAPAPMSSSNRVPLRLPTRISPSTTGGGRLIVKTPGANNIA